MRDDQLEEPEVQLTIMQELPKRYAEIKSNYSIQWENDLIVGTPAYIFNWFLNENFNIDGVSSFMDSIYFNIHDLSDSWLATAYRVTNMENNQ